MKFKYDLYIPLDSENTTSETTQKEVINKMSFNKLINKFDWVKYKASPTITVYNENDELKLWFSRFSVSDDEEKLEMFIIGFHEFISKKSFFGLGKEKIVEIKDITYTVGLTNIKSIYNLYFSNEIQKLKMKLTQLDEEIKFFN